MSWLFKDRVVIMKKIMSWLFKDPINSDLAPFDHAQSNSKPNQTISPFDSAKFFENILRVDSK